MHKRYLLSVLLLSLCLGCGTGDYESRIGKARGGGAASAADPLGPAEELPGTRVSIRVPRCVTLLPEGTDARRAKPMPIPLPGVQQRTYEGFIKDSDGGEIPFYCHIFAGETPKAPGQNAAGQLQTALSKAMGNAPPFTDVLATSPEGKDIKWQMTRLTSPQEFYYRDKTGKETYKSMDGIGEMYVHEEAGFTVIITWRLPSAIEKNVGSVGLAQLAKLAAGGVSVKPQ